MYALFHSNPFYLGDVINEKEQGPVLLLHFRHYSLSICQTYVTIGRLSGTESGFGSRWIWSACFSQARGLGDNGCYSVSGTTLTYVGGDFGGWIECIERSISDRILIFSG